MKRWKKHVIVWLTVTIMFTGLPVCAEAPAETELYAKAAVLMDAQSGRVLYEKNGQEVLAMASTTKILTCILALELADMDEMVDVSAYAATMPKVKLYVKKGERYRLGDLLHSLMLESHNDVAVVVAEHIGKEILEQELAQKSVAEYTTEESKKAVAAFANLMNEKAQSLGCVNSWFITPNGLDATETFHAKDETTFTKNHSTTATELATIMSYCILHSPKKEEFLKITQAPSYSFSSEEGRSHSCTNHNAFLNMMSGVISGKTGFTNQAGYCYVGALERDGRTYVVALLACGWPNNKTYKWTDTKKLMNYGIDTFFYRKIDEEAVEEKLPQRIPVQNGQTEYIGQNAYVGYEIISGEEKTLFGDNPEGLLMAEGEEIEVRVDVTDFLEAPVYKGDVIGTISYVVDGKEYKRKELILVSDVKKIDFRWCLEKVFDLYM